MSAVLEPQSITKFLGVTIDNKPNLNGQVKKIENEQHQVVFNVNIIKCRL